ncbi:phosphate ABC transporter substrate-binding protein [Massilia cavernae]|uniref:Phosphate ABC transporter substrate-binding protein n=2 Tax=Massilia cavernae TaxID=2320864 RepID=A0A418XFQ8_9BURK|nr:phosphate ABC transporter substrate-binding protein [Massilia cavernae]
MRALLDTWMEAVRKHQPGLKRGTRWEHRGDATAVGELMFERTDIAAMSRLPTAAELSPYAHQFHGDMMKTPLMLQVAHRASKPIYVAVNKRAGAPLPQRVKELLAFILSQEGQALVPAHGYQPLAAQEALEGRARIAEYLAPLDPGLAPYAASRPVQGRLRSVGSDGMKTLMDRWMREFRRVQPGVLTGERWEHFGTMNGFHALIAGETDIAPMGREIWPDELATFRSTRPGSELVEIRVARGGFNTPQRTTAQAIFVHQDNPLERITLDQLRGILGQPQAIATWGQLGLTGDWAARPIQVYTPPSAAPNSMSMQMMVLRSGPWNAGARPGSIADTAKAIARDPAALGFGGFEEGGPGLKTLAVAGSAGGPFIAGTSADAASGRYPLTRYMYIRLSREPGQPLPAPAREFLRYVLSAQGQEPIRYSGYFPLSAAEARAELAKLD